MDPPAQDEDHKVLEALCGSSKARHNSQTLAEVYANLEHFKTPDALKCGYGRALFPTF